MQTLWFVLFVLVVSWAQAQNPGGSPCTVPGDCLSGVCGANNICCGGDWVDCTGDCVNTQTDPTHCGDCDTVCSVGQSCVGGICAFITATDLLFLSLSLSLGTHAHLGVGE